MRTYKAFANDGGYDVHDCPDEPPDDYPFAWPILEVLNHWPPDDPKPQLDIHQGLCVFDFQTDYDKVMTYRNAEVPYVVRNDPEVARSVELPRIHGASHEQRATPYGIFTQQSLYVLGQTQSQSQEKEAQKWKAFT
jgi:hypothetical protein